MTNFDIAIVQIRNSANDFQGNKVTSDLEILMSNKKKKNSHQWVGTVTVTTP